MKESSAFERGALSLRQAFGRGFKYVFIVAEIRQYPQNRGTTWVKEPFAFEFLCFHLCVIT